MHVCVSVLKSNKYDGLLDFSSSYDREWLKISHTLAENYLNIEELIWKLNKTVKLVDRLIYIALLL